ncbi:hypothetical protein O181_000104 [Austropuccinia psidii MF-1]|uniref:Uncharacterized protein n=1 Tax=Austropuccinia psidii MF-1 TaxID=1389203 RepID=A0A9Q3GAK2_9BASI|nr:hypothetical protein [Austropuccinia psidii MF-1]
MGDRIFKLESHWPELREIFQRLNLISQNLELKQEAQTPGGKGSQAQGQLSYYQSYGREMEPERSYYDYFRLTKKRKTIQLLSGIAPLRIPKFSGQELPFFPNPHSFKGKGWIERQAQDIFQQGPKDSDPMIQELQELVN